MSAGSAPLLSTGAKHHHEKREQREYCRRKLSKPVLRRGMPLIIAFCGTYCLLHHMRFNFYCGRPKTEVLVNRYAPAAAAQNRKLSESRTDHERPSPKETIIDFETDYEYHKKLQPCRWAKSLCNVSRAFIQPHIPSKLPTLDFPTTFSYSIMFSVAPPNPDQ